MLGPARAARLAVQLRAPVATSAPACARLLSATTTPPPASSSPPDYLLKFGRASTSRDVHHYTSYFLAAGIPAALVLGGPVASVVDVVLGVAIPVHFHIGVRSILVDYVHDPTNQRIGLAVLAGVSVLTAIGLTKFNLTDEGITGAVKDLWVKQSPPAPPAAKGPF